ncbi:MAG: archaeosortase/exosortase family protein [Verrucomicrobia bacterium]|nr:archaeosortase/exosortase family protein [Verrucomicrobiota bacterium]
MNALVWPASLAAFLLLWAAGVRQWYVEWEFNPLYSYGWAVPALIAWLAWRELEHLPPPGAARRSWAAVGLLGAASLLPLRLVLEANPDWRLLSFLLAVLVVGISLTLTDRIGGAPYVRAFTPIFGLIFFALPWPQSWEYAVVQRLTGALTALTVEFLNLFGLAAVQRGNVIEVATGLVGVSDACSGIRSLQATLMLAAFLGQLFRLSWPRRLLLFPVGFAVAAVTNVVRTLFLSVLAARRGSIDAWHDPAGFMILGVCFVVLWWIGSRWRQDSSEPSKTLTPAGLPLRWTLPLIGWVLGVELGNAAWYRWHEREVAIRGDLLWRFEYPTQAPGFAEEKIPDDERTILRANAQRAARWEDESGVEIMAVTLRWEASRAAAQLAHQHTPEVCHTANGHLFAGHLGIVRLPVPSLGGLSLPFARYVFMAEQRRLFVFRCLTEDGTRAEAPIRGADYGIGARLRAALEGRRNLGQRSLELTASAPGLDEEAALAVVSQVVARGVQPDRPK